MKLSERGEISLLKRIRERFAIRSKEVITGIGDDSAVVMPHDQNLLLTTDMMVEGTHFNLNFMNPCQLGFKIISVNVSDVYAMGGDPRFILLDIAWGGDTDDGFMESFFDGVERAMSKYSLQLIGGDLSSTQSFMTIAATLIGYAKKPVLRSGARPGDRIYVTGTLGDSACGFALLKVINRPLSLESGEKTDSPVAWSVMRPLITRHLMPEARNPRQFSSRASAMIDISDGLFIDLSRICDESGVGARIYLKQVPLSPQMKKAASALGLDPYTLATSGGEDYELLFTAPSRRKLDAPCIGEITTSDRVVVHLDKSEKPFFAEGYRHWQ
ncbi:MAG: thiamine-phosphate kinase [Thermodesulfovibrionales bacterium]|jgi:thiamine-monophosphate kinase